MANSESWGSEDEAVIIDVKRDLHFLSAMNSIERRDNHNDKIIKAVNRTPGMAPHMAPIFIELLSRLQIPPSTWSLIAIEAAMESSALALVSALSFHEARDAEEKMSFFEASSRG